MKKLIFFLTCMAVFHNLNGQFSPIFEKAAEELKNDLLEVVLTGDPEFDQALELALTEELSQYNYKLISQEDFDKKHKQGEEIFALILSTGEFDLPMSGNLTAVYKNLPFYGIIREYHKKGGDYKPGYSIVSYTLSIPGQNHLEINAAMHLFFRNLNNEVRKPKEEFYDNLHERQDWAQEKNLLIPDEDFDCMMSDLKKAYPYPAKIVKNKKISEAVNIKEEAIICIPTVVSAEGNTMNVLYLNYFYIPDGTLIDQGHAPFLAKKDPQKYKAMKAKAEQKALRVYAKNVR